MLDQSRLEATRAPANPDRPRRKPLGATFWKLFTAFLFFGPALAVFLIGYLIINAVAGGEKPEAPPIQAPAEEAAPAPPNAVEGVPELPPASGRVQPDGDVIYQDEAGTWLNTKRGPEPGPHIVGRQLAQLPDEQSQPQRPAAGSGPIQAPSAPPLANEAGQMPGLMSLGLNLLTGGSAQNWLEPAPVTIAKADQFYQDENGVWRNTGAGQQAPASSEHIYRDDEGVWRNLSQGSGPDSASPAPVAANPMASLMSGLVSQGGEAGGSPAVDLLGGLLGSGDLGSGGLAGGDLVGLMGALLGGGGQGGGLAGGDLAGLMGALMGGGDQGGGDLGGLMGALMGGGDLSGLMGTLMNGGQGGDLSALMNGLRPGMEPSGGGGEIAPLNITRARPQAFDASGQASRASQITSGAGGLNLEGYERFDPAKAGQIKSDWEFFDDPR